MKSGRTVYVAAIAAAVLLTGAERLAMTQGAVKATPPAFQFDPSWPKPLPNNWVVGNVVGVAVDSKDIVWMVHRPASQVGADKTPPVLAFDQAGNLVHSWGGKAEGIDWGGQAHGLYIDPDDNVWVGFGGGLPYDPKARTTTDNANFLKMTQDGKKVLLEVGKFGMGTEGSNSTKYLGQPTDVWVDKAAHEAYITDGYSNRRIIVVDSNTGEYKRHWGAFGKKPDDGPQPKFSREGKPRDQFDTPHCIVGTHDGLLYVCDRGNQRIQVFKHDGTFVKDALINAKLDDGSVGGTPWDIALSNDPQQRYIFLVDGATHKVHTLLRETLEVVSSFGHHGRWGGEFESPHSIAIDSKGNLYVAETLDGRRLQRFLVRKAMAKKTTTQ